DGAKSIGTLGLHFPQVLVMASTDIVIRPTDQVNINVEVTTILGVMAMTKRQLLTAAALQLTLHAFSSRAFANTSQPTQRMIETNGIRLNVAEQGEGPV